jgi:hypothetical protein
LYKHRCMMNLKRSKAEPMSRGGSGLAAFGY